MAATTAGAAVRTTTATRAEFGAALAGLVVCLVRVFTDLRDGLGGDTADYIATARDLGAETRYPPGMGLVLAPFSWSVGGMQVVMVAATVGLVVVMWAAAVRIAGWWAGAVVSVLMLLTPRLLAHGNLIMADRLGALLVVGALLAVLHDRPRLAGVLAGLAGWVRLPAVGFCVGLPRRAWLTAGLMIVALAVWQVSVHGSLVGYSHEAASWSPSYVLHPLQLESAGNPPVLSNLFYWPAVLLGVGGGWVAPGVALIGGVGIAQRWRDPAARFAAGVVVLTLATLFPYFAQSARLILPAGCMVTIYAASALVTLSRNRGS